MGRPVRLRRYRARVSALAISLLAVVAGTTFAGCSSSPAASSAATGSSGTLPSVTLAIGSITALPTLPLQIAIGDHLFAKYGVNLKVEITGSGTTAVDALLSGNADVSADFYDHVLELAGLNKRLTSFVEMTDMPGYALVVAGKDASQIRSVADLAGKTVGVSAPGSATAFFVSYLLAKAGQAPTAAHFVGIGIGATAVAAVEHGTVDAAVLYDPALSEVLAKDPTARVLVDARKLSQSMSIYGAASYPSMTIFGTPSWVAAHPSEAKSVAEAIAAADRYLHTASVSEIISHLSPQAVGSNTAFFERLLGITIPYVSSTGYLQGTALRNVLAVQSLANPAIKRAGIVLASTYTDQFVPGS